MGYVDAAGTDAHVGIERLLREAVDRLGTEETGRAAQYLFGLIQGTIGRRPTDLRERAAREFGNLSSETFRKSHERLLLDRIAAEMIQLAMPPEPTANDPASSLRRALQRDLDAVRQRADPARSDEVHHGRYGPYLIPVGDPDGSGSPDATPATTRITVDCGAVEELRDVHFIVSSENTYLAPARPFSSTLSGQLRNAAAERDTSGAVITDIVAEELAEWVRMHGRPGSPVEPGAVAVTSSGSLRAKGVRAILHAAVAVPRQGGQSAHQAYDVPSDGVSRAVHRCFELARTHPDSPAAHGELTSITFPLFGAGEGGLGAAGSISRLWPTLRAELALDPNWHVHLTTWTADETATVLQCLLDGLRPDALRTESGPLPVDPSGPTAALAPISAPASTPGADSSGAAVTTPSPGPQ